MNFDKKIKYHSCTSCAHGPPQALVNMCYWRKNDGHGSHSVNVEKIRPTTTFLLLLLLLSFCFYCLFFKELIACSVSFPFIYRFVQLKCLSTNAVTSNFNTTALTHRTLLLTIKCTIKMMRPR